MDKKPSAQPQKILKGRQARSVRDEEDRRVYGPFRVRMQVQLSPLSVTSDTLEFLVYQSTGEAAISATSLLLKQWYVLAKNPVDNYPKPVGFGAAVPISDQEFRMAWQQAEHEGREVLKAGDQRDPVAVHIKPRSTTIILPGNA